MLLIEHRINTLEALRRVPPQHGIEIDIRDYDGHLVLTHDPFESGEKLEDLLAAVDHALVVFNVKCDGLEEPIRELADRFGINDYFFLDLAPPTLVRLALAGERRLAVRYSEHEPIEGALAFAGRAEWVWIDCFTHLPLDPSSYRRLAEHFKICLVSPELQGHARSRIGELRRDLEHLQVDAVCTDFPGDWS